jgi:peptide/nickel transport system substrate-binding protein
MVDPRRPGPGVTRRAFLGAAGLGLAGIYLAGCKSDSAVPGTTTTSGATTGASTGGQGAASTGPVPGPSSGGGTPGGKIVVGFLNEGNSWDPAIGYTETSWDSICNLTFAALLTYGADGTTPAANAAAELPEVSSDGRVHTIRLRDGVMFHNGRAVVAQDYKYAWERALDPKVESWAASYLYSIEGARELYRKKAKELAGVRVIDDMTLEVTLSRPDVTFLYALTQPFTAPVPEEEVKRLGDDWGTKTVVGNGPYRMVSYDSVGQKAGFEKHEAHFWAGLPYVDEIEFQWGLDAAVQLLKMQRGDVDVLYSGFTPEQLARVNSSDALKPFLFQQPLFANRWINLHPRVPAFRNRDVREALNWATDREQLSRITGAEAEPWGAPYPPAYGEQVRTFSPYTYDPERARSLLAGSGVSDLRATLYLTESPEPQLGQVIQQQWNDVGFNLEVKQIGLDASYELSLDDKLDAWFSTYYAIYPTAIDLLQYYTSDGTSNYTGYSNPEVDRLVAQASQTVDPTARDTLLAQVEQIIGDDAVHVFLQNVNWLMGVNQERLQNFHYSGVYGAYYDRLWVES